MLLVAVFKAGVEEEEGTEEEDRDEVTEGVVRQTGWAELPSLSNRVDREDVDWLLVVLETTPPSQTFVVMTATREGSDLVFVVVMLVLASVTELTTETMLPLLWLVVGGLGGGPFGRRGGSGGG